ncbi:MAG TPA: glycine cleavage system protein GcvH [Candidatus Lokiarchaeia archaeon]|nr:glycine cleavage system protein GcvH [Candidatus Lokiarchaeia archaeon]
MSVPDDLKYTKSHEWVRIEDVVVMGITDHAQHELTDIVYIDDYPEIGSEITKGSVIAVIESVKAVAEVYAPVSGILKEVNGDLENAPESLNAAPYDAWIAKIEPSNQEEFDELLSPEAYQEALSS